MKSILAQMDFDNFDGPWQGLGRFWHDYLVLFAVLGSVALVTLIWAAFFRKRPKHRFHHFGHRSRPRTAMPEPVNGNQHNGHNGSSRHKHRRHLRREHRPRNPTLSETGGLPPARPEAPPEPFP